MTRLRIGTLRHRLSLEAVARAPDGGGGGTETWGAIAEVWAGVTPVSGIETSIAEGVSGRVTHIVHIRHRAGVQPAMRFRFGARLLDITAVLDADERRRHLKCLCRERDL